MDVFKKQTDEQIGGVADWLLIGGGLVSGLTALGVNVLGMIPMANITVWAFGLFGISAAWKIIKLV